MKLSLPILKDWFTRRHQAVVANVLNTSAELVSFCISEVPQPKNIGQIRASGEDASIISGSDSLLIKSMTPEQTMNAVFEAYEFYSSWETALYQKITGDTNLQELLELNTEVFNRPMSICNSKGWDYAMLGGDGPYIHPSSETLTSNDSSEDGSETTRQTFLSSHNGVQPVVAFSPSHQGNILIANIWLEGDKYGAILAYENGKPFTLADIQLMEVFQTVITVYATINKGVLRSRSVLSEYLIDMLERKSLKKYSPNKVLKFLNWKASDTYCVLAIAARKTADSVHLSHLCDELETAIYKPQAFLYDNRIICLLRVKDIPDFQNLTNEIKYSIPEHIYAWGLSHEFHGISEFSTYYSQSCHALAHSIAKNVPGYTMSNIACTYIRRRCSDDFILQSYLHPDVETLIEYDKQNHTVYANSLYWYLFYSCNFTDAANRMNLHRNTLIYRINRITELIHADLTKAEDRELLLLSFLLYKEVPAAEKKKH